MRTSTIVMGLVGGVALALALAAPLYIALPARYLRDWLYMTPQGGLAGMITALAVFGGIGFAAARLNPEEPVRSGTSAGLIASLIGSVLIVLPAGAIEACSDLIVLAGGGQAQPDALRTAAAESLIALAWLPATATAALTCTGAALGAVGGVSFDLWHGEPTHPGRDVHRSPVPLAGLASTVLISAVVAQFSSVNATTLGLLSHEPTLIDRIKLGVPAGMIAVSCALLVCWNLRDAVLMYRASRRMGALVWSVPALTLPLLVLAVIGLLHMPLLLSPALWIGLALGGFSIVVVVFSTFRAEEFLDKSTRLLGELLGEALLAGVLLVGQAMLVGGSAAIAVAIIVTPYTSALISDASSVTTPPEQLVTNVFRAHWVAGVGALGLAVGWLLLRLPVWFGRSFARRR